MNNTEIWNRTKVPDIIERIVSLQWRRVGHVTELNTPKVYNIKVTKWTPRVTNRNVGRPLLRWVKDFWTIISALFIIFIIQWNKVEKNFSYHCIWPSQISFENHVYSKNKHNKINNRPILVKLDGRLIFLGEKVLYWLISGKYNSRHSNKFRCSLCYIFVFSEPVVRIEPTNRSTVVWKLRSFNPRLAEFVGMSGISVNVMYNE